LCWGRTREGKSTNRVNLGVKEVYRGGGGGGGGAEAEGVRRGVGGWEG